MGKVFVSVGASLDGFVAGQGGGPRNPLGDGGAAVHAWAFRQRTFRRSLGLGEDGETGGDDAVLSATLARTGATIIGKRMFEEGEASWPEEAPFRTPVFVLTGEVRRPWERKGGTTFVFVNDGIESALLQAREAAGPRDVRVGGGAATIREYLHAGLVEELCLSVAPVLLGRGVRLLDGVDPERVALEPVETVAGQGVTHLRYRVSRPTSDRDASTARLVRRPPAAVLAAFADPARLARWWGPKGFRNTFEAFDFRPGGAWRYVMHGPDGRSYPNESAFAEVGPGRVVIDHVVKPRYRLTVTLDAEGGWTRLGWRQRFETAELCRKLLAIVGPANEENLDRLEAELERGG